MINVILQGKSITAFGTAHFGKQLLLTPRAWFDMSPPPPKAELSAEVRVPFNFTASYISLQTVDLWYNSKASSDKASYSFFTQHMAIKLPNKLAGPEHLSRLLWVNVKLT